VLLICFLVIYLWGYGVILKVIYYDLKKIQLRTKSYSNQRTPTTMMTYVGRNQLLILVHRDMWKCRPQK
jgi:hypothetical protein